MQHQGFVLKLSLSTAFTIEVLRLLPVDVANAHTTWSMSTSQACLAGWPAQPPAQPPPNPPTPPLQAQPSARKLRVLEAKRAELREALELRKRLPLLERETRTRPTWASGLEGLGWVELVGLG